MTDTAPAPNALTGDARIRADNDHIDAFAFATVACTTAPPLRDARVAIVTTAGLRPAGSELWNAGDQSFTVLDGAERDLMVAHASANFDRSGVAADLDVVYPVDRLAELAAAGEIGSVAPRHLSFMGAQPDHTMATIRLDTGPAAAKLLLEDGVDVVLLTPV